MHFWSRLAKFVWREAEAPASAAPEPRAPREGSGVPEYLRKAVRCAVVGFTATVLTAGIINVRLIARVDADDSYSQCLMNCQTQENVCLGTGPGSCTAALNAALGQCITQSGIDWGNCQSLSGDAQAVCLRRTEARRRCCNCRARLDNAKCRVNCVATFNGCQGSCQR